MKQCTITHEGETCIVVWLRMPPINNLFLFLVHTEQGGVVEPITVPVAIPLDENKCCFLPEFNGEALAQLDLCRFSLQSAKRTRGMFLGCTSLKEILTTKLFDTQDVLDGYKMFERCISLPNYRNNILVQSAMARPIKDGGYLTMTSKRVLAQDLKALQS